jgi:hypothetical protein
VLTFAGTAGALQPSARHDRGGASARHSETGRFGHPDGVQVWLRGREKRFQVAIHYMQTSGVSLDERTPGLVCDKSRQDPQDCSLNNL